MELNIIQWYLKKKPNARGRVNENKQKSLKINKVQNNPTDFNGIKRKYNEI